MLFWVILSMLLVELLVNRNRGMFVAGFIGRTIDWVICYPPAVSDCTVMLTVKRYDRPDYNYFT